MKRTAICFLPLLLAACWNTGFDWSLHGTVHDSATGAPIAAASIIIQNCLQVGDRGNQEAQDVDAASDQAGRFVITSLGDGPTLECKLVVFAVGYAKSCTPLSQLCTDVSDGHCKGGRADIVLISSDAGPAGCP